VVPFAALHLACLAVFLVGWSPVAVGVAVAFYALRMFAITGFYHRYFSHRAFETSRPMQFAFALVGASAVQRGPLWWAAHHRAHHRWADEDPDRHSPVRQGFWWSHVGWILAHENFHTRRELVGDLMRFAELRWLDRFDTVVPLLLIPAFYALGALLEAVAPGLGTNGWQMLVWGFVVSTTVLYHATFTINSLAHRFGSRAYETSDHSRNNAWLALITFGEGWHNNHHYYCASVRQGFRWWQLDLTYYGLRAMAAVGMIRGLRPVPAPVLAEARRRRA
jgi:stearoyl-CoA desaturase (delta-9 desaturase)